MRRTLVQGSVLAMACLAGCAPAPSDDVGTIEQAVVSTNGTSVNGTSVNGTSVNGTSVNGPSLNGIFLNGTSVNGTLVNGTSVNGTSVNGVTLDQTTLRGELGRQLIEGAAFKGATLWGTATGPDGEKPVELHIDDLKYVEIPNGKVTQSVWLYTISQAVPSNGGTTYVPICGTRPNIQGSDPVEVLPVAGLWNLKTGDKVSSANTEITFACYDRVNAPLRSSSIAKCVALGYRPWDKSDSYDGDLYHQACVRMLRGDYCGTGQPMTVNGTLINLYDDQGIQTDDANGANWRFEALWTPKGAFCVTDPRVKGQTIPVVVRADGRPMVRDLYELTIVIVRQTCPWRLFPPASGPACGKALLGLPVNNGDPRTLIATERNVSLLQFFASIGGLTQ